MMEVDIWADDIHKHPKYLKEEIIEWYKQRNYDKQEFKINYIFKHIFKVSYKSDYEEDSAEMQIVADPDDDGNYPIYINNYPYLVAGKIIPSPS
jgi:hypothetical protein